MNHNGDTFYFEKGPRTLRLATGELKELNSLQLVNLLESYKFGDYLLWPVLIVPIFEVGNEDLSLKMEMSILVILVCGHQTYKTYLLFFFI